MINLRSLFISSVLTITSLSVMAADLISMKQIYNYASKQDVSALKNIKNQLETLDSKGNTAVCQAILNEDVKTYNTLIRAGANANAACIKNIPQAAYNNFMTSVAQSGMSGGDVAATGTVAGTTATATSTGTFLGMGAVGWGITGAVVAGGVAAAAGGGGGGGGGSGAAPAPNPCDGITCGTNASCSAGSCVCNSGYEGDAKTACTLIPLDCHSGTQTGTKCTCNAGYTGSDCTQTVNCGYTTTSCGTGYEATGETCQSGETVYTKCNPINCAAQGYSASCGAGYDATQSCLSGTVPYYTCTPKDVPAGYQLAECGEGYNEIGIFLSGETTYHKCQEKVLPAGYNQTSDCSGGYERDGEPFLSGETTYYKCKEKDCGEYEASCGEGYTATPACLSGTTPYYTCTPINCGINGTWSKSGCICQAGWSGTYCEIKEACDSSFNLSSCPTTGVCEKCSSNGGFKYKLSACLEGWQGNYCEVATSCPYSTTSCLDGWYETGNTCKSGSTTYKECAENQCPYSTTSCGLGYEETGKTCKSGSITYKECTEYGCSEDYSLNACPTYANCEECPTGQNVKYKVLSCQDGYHGDFCEQENPDCGAGRYINGSCVCNEHATKQNGICACVSGYSILLNGECSRHYSVGKSSNLNNQTIAITNDIDSDVYGLYSIQDTDYTCNAKSPTNTHQAATGIIDIIKSNKGNVYGVYSSGTSSFTYNAFSRSQTATGTINISTTGSDNVYGLYSIDDRDTSNAYSSGGIANGTIDMTNEGDNNVYGIYSNKRETTNAESYTTGIANGTIDIKNEGNGNIYGIYNDKAFVKNASSDRDSSSKGKINILNVGNGNIYGIYAQYAYNANPGNGESLRNTNSATGTIDITNTGNGNIHGIYATEYAYNAYSKSGAYWYATGNIKIKNKGLGNAYGMWASDVNNDFILEKNNNEAIIVRYSSTIEMFNEEAGSIIGIFGKTNAMNSGDITIHNLDNGIAVGMMVEENGTATNSGTITISHNTYTDNMGTIFDTSDDITYVASSERGGTAIGIYGGANSTITNETDGKIIINGADTAYGIYAESGSTVTNNGQITIDGVSCSGTNCNANGNAIKLNGGKLFQNGALIATNTNAVPTSLMSTASTLQMPTAQNVEATPKTSLNLDDFGGTVVASNTSQFVVEGALSGDLEINNDVITDGFKTTYTVSDMIQAGDSSGLNLKAQSALFDASLADNGHDVVMKMKSFDTVTDNSSFAQFLATNYALGQNEAFFNTLKQIGSMSELTGSLDKVMGKEMLSRFAFEDMTMMRELNFDMNNHLFNNKESYFSIGSSVSSPMAFKGDNGSNSRYSLSSKSDGVWSIGLGVAFTDIRSDDDNDNNSRSDTMYQMIMPIGYKAAGFHLMTSPRLGYARGSYDRIGFNDKSYDGTIEKRIFGLMNEARYPIALGNWKFEPAVEFNALGYEQKGWEEKKEFSLNIPTQRTYSVESGIGLYVTHQRELNKDSKFKFTAGMAAYHEFADPYKVDVGMNGLSGHFTLRDENRSDNRAVARTGFEFNRKDYSLTGSFISYIDREVRTKANLGFKWKF